MIATRLNSILASLMTAAVLLYAAAVVIESAGHIAALA